MAEKKSSKEDGYKVKGGTLEASGEFNPLGPNPKKVNKVDDDSKEKEEVVFKTSDVNDNSDKKERAESDSGHSDEDDEESENDDSDKDKSNSENEKLDDEKKSEKRPKKHKPEKRKVKAGHAWTFIVIAIILAALIVIVALRNNYVWPFNRPSNFVVARVSGTAIVAQDVNNVYDSLQFPYTLYYTKKDVLNLLINQTLLINKAEAMGFSATDSEVENDLSSLLLKNNMTYQNFTELLKNSSLSINDVKDNIRKKILLQKVSDYVTKNISVNESELINYYDKIKSQTKLSFDALKENLTSDLLEQKKQAAEQNFVTSLYDSAVANHEIVIYFNYSDKPALNMSDINVTNSTADTGTNDMNYSSQGSGVNSSDNFGIQNNASSASINNSGNVTNTSLKNSSVFSSKNITVGNATKLIKCAQGYNITTNLAYIYSLGCNSCNLELDYLKSINADFTLINASENSNRDMGFVINCLGQIQIPELVCLKNGSAYVINSDLSNLRDSDRQGVLDFANSCN